MQAVTTGKTTQLLHTRAQRLQMWAQHADWYQVGALTLLGGLVVAGFMRETLGGQEQARAATPNTPDTIVVFATAQPALADLWVAPSPTAPLALIPQPPLPAANMAVPTPAPIAGGTAPASQVGTSPVFALPPGDLHLHQNPDGSYYTVGDGQTRYYLDGRGTIVEVRLPGSEPAPGAAAEPAGAPPEQKIFLDPANPADAAYLAAQPTAAPARGCSGRCIHPPSK